MGVISRSPGQIARLITRYGVLVARPLAFVIVTAYGVGWFVFEPDSFNWHAVATLAIWYMTLLIQRVGHRDTQAIHAKLDELLRAQDSAHTEFARLDEQEPEEIERHRQLARRGQGEET